MEPVATGDTTASRPSGETSSTGKETPTQNLEEIMRERDGLKQSLQAVARERDEWKVKANSHQIDPPPDDRADEEEWISPSKAREIARSEYQAIRAKESEEYQKQLAINQERQTWLNKAATDIPESLDKNSPVYKKALELFNDPNEGLSQQVNGGFSPRYPNAEYIAFSRAKTILSSKASAASDAKAAAQFASAGGGSASSAQAGSTGELSDEEFLKLSPDEQLKYQENKFMSKHGVST